MEIEVKDLSNVMDSALSTSVGNIEIETIKQEDTLSDLEDEEEEEEQTEIHNVENEVEVETLRSNLRVKLLRDKISFEKIGITRDDIESASLEMLKEYKSLYDSFAFGSVHTTIIEGVYKYGVLAFSKLIGVDFNFEGFKRDDNYNIIISTSPIGHYMDIIPQWGKSVMLTFSTLLKYRK